MNERVDEFRRNADRLTGIAIIGTIEAQRAAIQKFVDDWQSSEGVVVGRRLANTMANLERVKGTLNKGERDLYNMIRAAIKADVRQQSSEGGVCDICGLSDCPPGSEEAMESEGVVAQHSDLQSSERVVPKHIEDRSHLIDFDDGMDDGEPSEDVVVEVFETDGTGDCTMTAGGVTISIPCQFAAILGDGKYRLIAAR